jgi:hypothetical protein
MHDSEADKYVPCKSYLAKTQNIIKILFDKKIQIFTKIIKIKNNELTRLD